MNLLQKLTPEALAKLDQEAKKYPNTIELLKRELAEEENHFLNLKFNTVLTFIRCTDISLDIREIMKLFKDEEV